MNIPFIIVTFVSVILFVIVYLLFLRKYLAEKKWFEKIGTYIFVFIICCVLVATAVEKIAQSMRLNIVLVEKDGNGKVTHKVIEVYDREYTSSQGKEVYLEKTKWFIDNSTDEELVLYSTDYSKSHDGNESYTTTIPIEPKSFTPSPFVIDYFFQSPPSSIREKDKSSASKVTKWTLTLKSDSLLNN